MTRQKFRPGDIVTVTVNQPMSAVLTVGDTCQIIGCRDKHILRVESLETRERWFIRDYHCVLATELPPIEALVDQ